MEVFTVFEHYGYDYEGSETVLLGIFSTEERAEKYLKSVPDRSPEFDHYYVGVTKYTLDRKDTHADS